jgi:Cu+-exporting ATPase
MPASEIAPSVLQPETHSGEKITLPVIGMSCAACQVHIEGVLRQTPGVEEANVNLMTNSATVRLGPTGSAQAVVEAIRESGYDAELPAASGAKEGFAAEQSEASLRRRAIFALAGGAVLMAATMLFGPAISEHPLAGLAMLAVTLFGMVWAGGWIYGRAWAAARHGSSNMHTLVSLGTLAAFGSSAAATLAPGMFRAHGLTPGLYYDSVLLILGFLLLGNWLDARAKRRTLDALRGFAALRPETATVVRGGVEVSIAADAVVSGDTVIVRPGERLCVDGLVLEGASSVDESLVTGESRPVVRTVGDTVVGGSLNYDGLLRYRATLVGKASMLGQIIALMESAQASKAPMQQLSDRVSQVFVPVVLGIAAVTFLVWTFAAGDASRALAVAVAVLVIACPCAMGLAVPAALTVAIGRAAQLGVLFKGGEELERLAGVDMVVFDKTGTLTEGKPRIVEAVPSPGVTMAKLLRVAASLEQGSEHPLAAAVLRYAPRAAASASELQARPGLGIVGKVDGKAAAAGNLALMAELGISVGQAGTGTVLHVACDGQYLGSLSAEDTLREGVPAAIAALHAMGLGTLMLTGDSHAAADAVAKLSGVRSFAAELRPEAKLARIVALQAEGHRVAMVGDGINDAAALAQADAGLAIGTGTDLARAAGGAILLHGSPAEIVAAIAVARRARATMRQNLGWAAGYNALGIPLAAGVLYPLTGLLLSPSIAAAAMALSSVSVLANSLRLRSYTPVN